MKTPVSSIFCTLAPWNNMLLLKHIRTDLLLNRSIKGSLSHYFMHSGMVNKLSSLRFFLQQLYGLNELNGGLGLWI